MSLPLFTDSHCHLGSHKFSDDEITALVANASANGIHRLVTLATSPADIPRNLAIAEEHETVFACVGIHPCDVQETPDDYLADLREAANHPKTAAIGETGLDYYHPAPQGWDDESYHARQRAFLRQHFELAAELSLNVVIHTRDRKGDASFRDALAIYEPFAEKVRAVFHCFPGPSSQAELVLKLGGLISFTGIATFKKAEQVVDAVVHCPGDRFMVETDAPYLAPVPFRGKRCEPAYVRHTAEKIAELREEPLAEVSARTEETVEQFFRLGS